MCCSVKKILLLAVSLSSLSVGDGACTLYAGYEKSIIRHMEAGEWPEARALIRKHPKLVNNFGGTLLSYAAAAGQRETILFLVRSGVDINQPDELGKTVLWQMIKEKNREMARFLLSLGASPYEDEDVYLQGMFALDSPTCFTLAVEQGDDDLLRDLIAAGDFHHNECMAALERARKTALERNFLRMAAYLFEAQEYCTKIAPYFAPPKKPTIGRVLAKKMGQVKRAVRALFREQLDSPVVAIEQRPLPNLASFLPMRGSWIHEELLRWAIFSHTNFVGGAMTPLRLFYDACINKGQRGNLFSALQSFCCDQNISVESVLTYRGFEREVVHALKKRGRPNTLVLLIRNRHFHHPYPDLLSGEEREGVGPTALRVYCAYGMQQRCGERMARAQLVDTRFKLD